MAPAVGMTTLLPISMVFTVAFRFSAATVVLCWLLVAAAVWLLARFLSLDAPIEDVGPTKSDSVGIKPAAAAILILSAAIAAILPASNLYPQLVQGRLYVNGPTFDHVKIAFTDAITREGLPLQNPFYAPQGRRIPLSYSYGWYVMAAEMKELTHATGWQAEVALTWFTSFAMISFLAAHACRLADNARAGVWLIALFLAGPVSMDLLPLVLGEHWMPLVGLPTSHGLEVPWLQLAWAPQHVFSALSVVIMLWLMSVAVVTAKLHWPLAIVIGLTAASAFASSIWVGGVALTAASPLLITAILSLRLRKAQYLNFAKAMATAVAVCVVFSIPLLLGLLSGTAKFQDKPPIGFAIFPSTLLEDHLHLGGYAKMAARIVLYWIHLLPLSLGAIYLIGLPAMILWIPRKWSERAFWTISLAATIGFLLVSQFISSTILANDLGWRAVNVSAMFMLVWASVAIAELLDPRRFAIRGWRIGSRAGSLKEFVTASAVSVLALGVLATAHLMSSPTIALAAAHAEEHRLFAQQARAWEIVRRYTRPTDLVQSNPDGFPTITPWQINLPYHLMADRPTAYASVGTGRTYAFRYSLLDNDRQYLLVRAAFRSDVKSKTLRALRFELNIKAILVTPEDGVWATKTIEESGLYRLVAATDAYKVYIAPGGPKH